MKKLVAAKMPFGETEAAVTVLYEEKLPLEIYADRLGKHTSAGDLFVGHVERVHEASGGAFVRFSAGETGFLPAKRMKNPVFTTPKKDSQIKAGDELIVQVKTEASGVKQAVLSANLKLPGRKELLEDILQKGIHRPWGTCLYRSKGPWAEILERYGREAFSRIVTDIEEVKDDLGDAAELYSDPMLRLFHLYEMSALLDRFTQKKVWLSGGGQLVIEPTEAFVCIDVNSAKAGSKKDREEYLLKVNKEAAEEAAVQIRARQLAGTILIDFITLSSKEAKEELIAFAEEKFRTDPVYTKVIDITPLGIMEITRQKKKKPLSEQIRAVRTGI